MAKEHILSDDEIRRLIPMAREGDQDAMMRIVDSQEGLTWKAARYWLKPAFEMADLMQIGRIGVVKAVRDFDPAAGTQFNSFATAYVRNEIRNQTMGQHRVLRVSAHTCNLRSKATRLARAKGIGRDAAMDELGYSREDRACVARSDIAIVNEDVSDYFTPAHLPVHRLPTVEDDGPRRIEDADESAYILGSLGEPWRQFVAMSWGMDGRERTAEQFAAEAGLTLQQVRWRRRQALAMMRERAGLAAGDQWRPA